MLPSADSDRVDQTAHRQQESPSSSSSSAAAAAAASLASFPNVEVDHDQAAHVSHVSPDDFVVKTFSAGTAAVQLAGKNASEAIDQHHEPLSEEEKELVKRQIDCRKRLIVMKSRNADEASGKPIIPQEDLQEWLDNLQLRLHQACLTPSAHQQGPSQPSQPSQPNPRPRTQRPPRLSVTFAPGPTLSVPCQSPRSVNSSPESSSSSSLPSSNKSVAHRLKVNQLTGGIIGNAANSASGVHPLITRPRSISVLTDQAAAALTDGNYIEQLQVSLQQASVSSLHERLQERKTSSVHPTLVDQLTNQKGANASVRARTPTHTSPSKTRGRKKSNSQLPVLPDKLVPTGSATSASRRDKSKKSDRHKASADETESMLSLSSSTSSRSLDQLIARQQARKQQEKLNEDKDSQRSPGSDRSSNDRPLTHSSPVPGRSRQFAPRDFFDSGQTVDDIYIAAEHLLLPPARREAAISEPTPTLQTETIIHIQRGSPDEEIQVEDFWGAMPDY